MKIKPLHTGISVRNLDEAKSWYAKNLGFELVFEKDFTDLKSRIAFMKLDDYEIELFEHYDSIAVPEARRFPMEDIKTQGTKHLCFQTDDIQTLFNQFKTNGVDIVFGPEARETDLMGFVRDPSGVLIEVIQRLNVPFE